MMIGEFDFGDTFLALEGLNANTDAPEEVHLAKVGRACVYLRMHTCASKIVHSNFVVLCIVFGYSSLIIFVF